MAKLQRWWRSGRAGEGDNPDEVQTEGVDASGEPDESDVPEAVSEPDEVEDEPEDEPEESDDAAVEEPGEPDEPARRTGFSPANWPPVALLQAAHPKQGIVTALAVFFVAVLAGRPARETGIILLTVLTGQAILGWHNDLVDRKRDKAHGTPGKPIADGRLTPANAWFALILAALLLLPLSITTGITAGMIYLASVAVGMLGNVLFRTTPLSLWSWAVSFGMLPAYISYGGWGGQAIGSPPETAMTILAGLLGIGVHFIRSVWGLVADHQDGWTYLPLKLGMKLGATWLLMLSSLYLFVVLVVMAIVAGNVGLSR